MPRDYARWISENSKDLLITVSDKLWESAETGLVEKKSSRLLVDTLKQAGFTVETGVADMPSAFVAHYGCEKPVIGILGEYDALPGLSQAAVPYKKPLREGFPGHGCGHNLLGTGSLGAVLAVKQAIDAKDAVGTIRYYGCPARHVGHERSDIVDRYDT